MTSWPAGGSLGTSASVSATVFPVMVSAPPCRRPRSRSIRITCGTPPTWWNSVVTKRPDGLRSHRTGTFARIASKSSRESGTSAAWAIAMRWSTAFVEPPIAITTAIAFSNASRVRIRRAVRPVRTASARTRADSAALSAFSASSAAIVDEPRRLMPIASKADDIVFAVYIPPQAPAPGMAFLSIASSSAWGSFPASYCPRASKTLTMLRSRRSPWQPGLIVPP